MMRTQRSGKSMPMAAAPLGRRLLLVMPGMVLISSTKGASSDYASAIYAVNQMFAAGTTNLVALNIAGDTYVFADSANSNTIGTVVKLQGIDVFSGLSASDFI